MQPHIHVCECSEYYNYQVELTTATPSTRRTSQQNSYVVLQQLRCQTGTRQLGQVLYELWGGNDHDNDNARAVLSDDPAATERSIPDRATGQGASGV